MQPSTAKARGGIVVIVAHRPDVLAAVDLILPMRAGRSQGLLERDEVQKQVGTLKARKVSRAHELKQLDNGAANPAADDDGGEPKGQPRLRLAVSQDVEGGAA